MITHPAAPTISKKSLRDELAEARAREAEAEIVALKSQLEALQEELARRNAGKN